MQNYNRSGSHTIDIIQNTQIVPPNDVKDFANGVEKLAILLKYKYEYYEHFSLVINILIIFN